MANPVPSANRAADRSETVIKLKAGIRIAPLAACHLAPARRRQHALASSRRELREVARDIGGRADEAGCGHDGGGWIIAPDHRAAAEQDAARVTARERRAARERHVAGR